MIWIIFTWQSLQCRPWGFSSGCWSLAGHMCSLLEPHSSASHSLGRVFSLFFRLNQLTNLVEDLLRKRERWLWRWSRGPWEDRGDQEEGEKAGQVRLEGKSRGNTGTGKQGKPRGKSKAGQGETGGSDPAENCQERRRTIMRPHAILHICLFSVLHQIFLMQNNVEFVLA